MEKTRKHQAQQQAHPQTKKPDNHQPQLTTNHCRRRRLPQRNWIKKISYSANCLHHFSFILVQTTIRFVPFYRSLNNKIV